MLAFKRTNVKLAAYKAKIKETYFVVRRTTRATLSAIASRQSRRCVALLVFIAQSMHTNARRLRHRASRAMRTKVQLSSFSEETSVREQETVGNARRWATEKSLSRARLRSRAARSVVDGVGVCARLARSRKHVGQTISIRRSRLLIESLV